MHPNEKNPTVEVNLSHLIAIPGYTPDPSSGHLYVIAAKKLITSTVVGYPNKKGIRSLICLAQVEDPAVQAVVGQYVILIDQRLVGMAKNPFTRKEVLALIEVQNSMCLPGANPDVSLYGNMQGAQEDTEYNSQITAMMSAAQKYGHAPMSNGVRKQQNMVLNSSRSVGHALRRDWKKMGANDASINPGPICNPFTGPVTT